MRRIGSSDTTRSASKATAAQRPSTASKNGSARSAQTQGSAGWVATAPKKPKPEVADRGMLSPRRLFDAVGHLTVAIERRNEEHPERLVTERVSMRGAPLFPAGTDNSLEVFDATQGLLHNCYFVAAVRTIARQEPQTIRDSIKELPDGSFRVRFFDNGKPEYVIVTPEFDPRYGGLPMNKEGKATALWPAVLQQAWIQWKGQGNIEGVEYRAPRTALEALTGRRTKQILSPFAMPGEANRRYDSLKEAMAKKLPVTVVTMPVMSEKEEKATGLHHSHTYEVRDVGVDAAGKRYIELTENHTNDVIRISPEVMAKHVALYEWLSTPAAPSKTSAARH